MELSLENIKEETADTMSFIFKSETDFSWEAGQFLHYTLPHPNSDDRKTERYFTISSAPHERRVMLTTRFAGADKSSTFKKALFDLRIGEKIEADGLEGDFIFSAPEREHVFIAGGIGITPFRSILVDLDHKNLPIKVALLYANKDKNGVIYQNELETLAAKQSNFKIHYFFEPQRIDEAAIRKIVTNIKEALYYVSGPEMMVVSFEKSLPLMGIPDRHIRRDYFPGYFWP